MVWLITDLYYFNYHFFNVLKLENDLTNYYVHLGNAVSIMIIYFTRALVSTSYNELLLIKLHACAIYIVSKTHGWINNFK